MHVCSFFLLCLHWNGSLHRHHGSMKALPAAMRQEGAHLWMTRLWQNNYLCELETFCLCCTHANAWSWSLHPPVLLCQVLSKPSQGKRVLQGSTSTSISDLERRSCWTRQTQIWLSDALMLCENAGGLIEFKLLGTDDQQIKCCSSPPPSSRQLLINPVLSHLSKNVLLLVQTRSCLYNQYIK